MTRRTRVRDLLEFGANRVLSTLGYELRDRALSERPEGFPGYLEEANRLGMDVNDFEEQRLGWRLPRPTLDHVLFPYLAEDSRVCEIGPGTGRWSRHILERIPRGELHLVDASPWMVRFLRAYFQRHANVHAHLGDGLSLPFDAGGWLDAVFSANTLVELELGVILLYACEFGRTLKRGGVAVIDYIDPTTEEGWRHLQTQGVDMAPVYTFHHPAVIDRVFQTAGLRVERRYQVGKSTFVVARRA
ncbi:MAG: class I SAM-dependent methyltransferase [Chloroflexota bacterium]|nr:class I SAM-dependent methyltransferase [Chloroflexota bacterium]